MYQKFKKGTVVVVKGMGKEDPIRRYKYRYGKVVERDDFFHDYKIRFKDGTTDWIDEKYLRHAKKENRRKLK